MIDKLSQLRGLAPGTPIYLGLPPQAETAYSCVQFDHENVEIQDFKSSSEVKSFFKKGFTRWVTAQGIHRAQDIAELCQFFGLHPLIVEDILNSEQRPKIEFFETCVFCVLRLFHIEENGQLEPENVSLVLGEDFVLLFTERNLDYCSSIRARLHVPGNRIMGIGASYLSFALLDMLVDHYYLVVEWLEDKIMLLDDQLFESPGDQILHEIHRLRKDAFVMHRFTRPLLEISNRFGQSESTLIDPKTKPYFRDLLDHSSQVVESMEAHKDSLFNLQSQYLALSSKKMNEVMQFLTMTGSVFIPLTFISGVYGMNFEFMPELGWKYGYFAVIGFMAVIAGGLLVYFRKKRWF